MTEGKYRRPYHVPAVKAVEFDPRQMSDTALYYEVIHCGGMPHREPPCGKCANLGVCGFWREWHRRGEPEPPGEKTWSIGEIADATGIKVATLKRRRAVLGIPVSACGYTWDEVKRIIADPVHKKVKDKRAVQTLREMIRKERTGTE